MSKDWLKKFEDIEEPGGVLACSPFIYAHSRLAQYALISPFAEQLRWLYECERENPRIEEDRLCWAVKRLERFLERRNPDYQVDAMKAQYEKILGKSWG